MKLGSRLPLFRLLGIAILPIALSLPAAAAPGDADTVIRHCGQPSGEGIANSVVTERLQRDLIYGPMRLHFIPDGAGWSFSTAWSGHLPVSRAQTEARMPCVRQALAESEAAQPLASADPTIAMEVPSTATISANTWGIPRLPLLFLLVLMVIALALIPWGRKHRRPRPRVPSLRRRPGIPSWIVRRRPKLTVLRSVPRGTTAG